MQSSEWYRLLLYWHSQRRCAIRTFAAKLTTGVDRAGMEILEQFAFQDAPNLQHRSIEGEVFQIQARPERSSRLQRLCPWDCGRTPSQNGTYSPRAWRR